MTTCGHCLGIGHTRWLAQAAFKITSSLLHSSRHCSLRTSRPAVGTALSVLLILSCCWVCSSRLLLAVLFRLLLAVFFRLLLAVLFRLLLTMLFCLLLAMLFCLLLAMLFCHFVPLSEILVDLLLVAVQVLRHCAPFRQSGFASFVDFFSSLALLAVMLSLFCVFWRRFPPAPPLW